MSRWQKHLEYPIDTAVSLTMHTPMSSYWSVLLLLEDKSTTTLKKMAKHICEEFEISVTPEEIQKTLKTVDITWKTVTQIPCKWNEASFLQQQHNYVLNQVTNTHPSCGLFVDWYVFFLLIMEKKNPVPPQKTSATSSAIMDNTPIHGGEDLERVQSLIKESAKKLERKFLPKYSPFLNTIELALKVLKTHFKHTKICSRLDLAQAI
ncbi:hypothetical protein VP01_2039g6 [Puccinia sorghi]|uniref:Tc1-like transposase DDE domain-containing protein n=1 Tax=Puccinia sorghi TaxID=27349 RepID=A0A0L6VB24_9BASI|nr:hypothetical protein VP01_2039g6 [Puccinia sorghi]